jgi:hypothetical protein
LADLVITLRLLNDSDLLTDSRNFSNFYAFSIGRWSQRRAELIYRNAGLQKCATQEIEKPYKKPVRDNFVPEIASDALLYCLTLKDIRELAAYEQPIMENPDQIGGAIGRPVDLSPGALPRRVDQASIAAETLLLFALIYFAAFASEATLSTMFPVPGTLFGAFSKSRSTTLALLLAICVPFSSSLALAIVARRWVLWAGCALILSASGLIFATFLNKFYFRALSPLNWKPRETDRVPQDVVGEQEDLTGLS